MVLKDNNKNPMAKVKLTLKIKKKTYKAKTNKKGKATFKIKKLTKRGKYKAVIKYRGNGCYKAVSKKGSNQIEVDDFFIYYFSYFFQASKCFLLHAFILMVFSFHISLIACLFADSYDVL